MLCIVYRWTSITFSLIHVTESFTMSTTYIIIECFASGKYSSFHTNIQFILYFSAWNQLNCMFSIDFFYLRNRGKSAGIFDFNLVKIHIKYLKAFVLIMTIKLSTKFYWNQLHWKIVWIYSCMWCDFIRFVTTNTNVYIYKRQHMQSMKKNDQFDHQK